MDYLFDDDRSGRRLLHRGRFDRHRRREVVTRRHRVARKRQGRRGREKAGQPNCAADSAQGRQANHAEGAVTGSCVVPPIHHSSPPPGEGDGDGDD
jgi:hypothetical protein